MNTTRDLRISRRNKQLLAVIHILELHVSLIPCNCYALYKSILCWIRWPLGLSFFTLCYFSVLYVFQTQTCCRQRLNINNHYLNAIFITFFNIQQKSLFRLRVLIQHYMLYLYFQSAIDLKVNVIFLKNFILFRS